MLDKMMGGIEVDNFTFCDLMSNIFQSILDQSFFGFHRTLTWFNNIDRKYVKR